LITTAKKEFLSWTAPIKRDVYPVDEPSVTAPPIVMACRYGPGRHHPYNAACEPHTAATLPLLNRMGARMSGVVQQMLITRGLPGRNPPYHAPNDKKVGSFIWVAAWTQSDYHHQKRGIDIPGHAFPKKSGSGHRNEFSGRRYPCARPRPLRNTNLSRRPRLLTISDTPPGFHPRNCEHCHGG